MYVIQNYEEMTADKRPQDEELNGDGWTFETLEHGGEYADAMPQAIRATDQDGRSCMYVPIRLNGRVVDSKGFVSSSRKGEKVCFSTSKMSDGQTEVFVVKELAQSGKVDSW